MFGRNPMERRIKTVEEALIDLTTDVSKLRLQVASMLGRYAAAHRGMGRKRIEDPEMEMLGEMFGGQPIGVYDEKEGKWKRINTEDDKE